MKTILGAILLVLSLQVFADNPIIVCDTKGHCEVVIVID